MQKIEREFNRLARGADKVRIDTLVKRMISKNIVRAEISKFFGIEKTPVTLTKVLIRL